jgi:hypothetical protein
MNQITRIIVADAQVPFVHGGAELHVRGLVDVLRRRGWVNMTSSWEHATRRRRRRRCAGGATNC